MIENVSPQPASGGQPRVRYRRVEVNGVGVFFREAGPPHAPVMVLLHGFPSSSFMFRELMPLLAGDFRVIAPDLPGFGASDFPAPGRFSYSFEGYARLLDAFLRDVDVSACSLYVQDYGAPVGFRLALLAPERIRGLVVQNGNAYLEGFSDAWEPLKEYWRQPTEANRERLRAWLTIDGIKLQYCAGLSAAMLELVAPETWELDWARLLRPGNIDVQLALFADYAANVAMYPEFQRFFREQQPPTLIAWGASDPFFTLDGARAYLRDLPSAELRVYEEAGHFALETHAREIGHLILEFAARRGLSGAAHERVVAPWRAEALDGMRRIRP